MHATKFLAIAAGLILLLSACSGFPVQQARQVGHETLIVYPDGSMEFNNRPIPGRDVVIYPDGYGGEKAAVRVHMQPLHPDFFRDTIVVERRSVPASETEVTQN